MYDSLSYVSVPPKYGVFCMSNELLFEQKFIADLIENQKPVSVFLKNGIKLTGVITGIDENCVFLKNMITQMIYKHAVSTIQP